MVLEQIKEMEKQLNEMINSFSYSMILPMQIYSKQMQDFIDSTLKPVINIDFKRIVKFKKRLDNINKSGFDYKWLRSISVPFGTTLMELHEKNGNTEVNKFLIELFRKKEEIEEFKEWLKHYSAYEKRKQIIDDCLQAHLDGKFTLSIPVLLTQCDGIIINKVKKSMRYLKEKKIDMRKITEYKEINMNKNLARQLKKIYNSRRIEILHGLNPHYFKNKKEYGEELSIKAIWTLFEIIHFISEIK